MSDWTLDMHFTFLELTHGAPIIILLSVETLQTFSQYANFKYSNEKSQDTNTININ
jgi:hypothetical protein